MSQFMTPAVTPDAVQSLAAGGQLLQEQYNQQQQNARTGAQIGAEMRMHGETLAQDSAEKAAYRELQARTSAAEITARNTNAAKDRELRVRLAMAAQEDAAALAEIENQAAEAAASGNPEAIKKAEEAREAFIKAKADKEAAGVAYASLQAKIGKAPGAVESEFSKTITGLIASQKMFKDAVGSKFREMMVRGSVNDESLPFATTLRALRDLLGGNNVDQAQADRTLATGQRSTTFLPNSAVTRSLERFAGDVNETVMNIMGETTRNPVSDEELRKHASKLATEMVSYISTSEEFGSIVEDPTKRAAAGSLMSQLASLLVAKGGTYALKTGSVAEGGKIAENAKPEIDNRIQDIAEELEKLGVTAQEQSDFFEALSENAAGALGVSDVQSGIAAASKTDATPGKYSGENAVDRQINRVFSGMGSAYRAALGGQVQGTKALEAFRDRVVQVLATFEGSESDEAVVRSLLSDAGSLGVREKLQDIFNSYGVLDYRGTRQKAVDAGNAATQAEIESNRAEREASRSRLTAANTVRAKGRQEASKRRRENYGPLLRPE